MCGICGIAVFGGGNAPVGDLEPMLDSLSSRGPDSAGVYCHAQTGLGHRRLKIIDLSEQAHQPMVDAFLGLTIVYNGAIYNYKELREELTQKGYRFFSNGDTEVILKAYHAWGEACVERMNGMFAFCILERDSGRLFLARDRLGIKPLYYLADNEKHKRFCFASTLPALLTQPAVDTRIDPVALNYYLSFHAVVPAPHTLVQGVRKLPPATTLTVEPDGSQRTQVYWELSFGRSTSEEKYVQEEWEALLLEALRQSVARRLTADVPVGLLLSGGLDSSLLVALLAEAGQHDLNTFSIGFEAVGGEAGDEFRYSDLIAAHFGTRHHQIRTASDELLGTLDACIDAMSEPMVSHDCIGFYLLSREVAKHVKVVQSGQGADEVFGGYHWYPPLVASTDPVADYAKVFLDRDFAEYRRVVRSNWVDRDWSRAFVADMFGTQSDMAAIDRALKLDTTIMLVDDPVKRVDNMTMAWGLEARVPFLDHELVELAARIPPELKVRQGGKYILQEVARKLVPAEVIDRPKGYFPVPALKYLQGDYLDLVRETVTGRAARERQLFNTDYVAELLADPEAHLTPLNGSKLWQIALLEWWLARHHL